MAPESINRREYSFKSDIWAFAMTMVEILTRQRPFPQLLPLEVASGVSQGKLIVEVPSIAPEEVGKILRDCCAFEAEARPTFEDVFITLSRVTAAENVMIQWLPSEDQ